MKYLAVYNEDKRRAVMTLLDDEEWRKWSDRKIAEICGLSNTFVGNMRSSLSTVDSDERRYTTKHGTEAVMQTAAIGQRVDNGPQHDAAFPSRRPAADCVRMAAIQFFSAGPMIGTQASRRLHQAGKNETAGMLRAFRPLSFVRGLLILGLDDALTFQPAAKGDDTKHDDCNHRQPRPGRKAAPSLPANP
ncbi:MAG: hypothetical protein SF339_18300 [Blastocatellia bacterium]|nr:hypothetical protein [Blastocatellia bacterium]